MKETHETTKCDNCCKKKVIQTEPISYGCSCLEASKDGWIEARVPNGHTIGGEEVDFCCFACMRDYAAKKVLELCK